MVPHALLVTGAGGWSCSEAGPEAGTYRISEILAHPPGRAARPPDVATARLGGRSVHEVGAVPVPCVVAGRVARLCGVSARLDLGDDGESRRDHHRSPELGPGEIGANQATRITPAFTIVAECRYALDRRRRSHRARHHAWNGYCADFVNAPTSNMHMATVRAVLLAGGWARTR